MKGGKGTYILLPAVIIVWTIIGYRIVKYAGGDNTVMPKPTIENTHFEPENFVADTFSIVADYRDPFLGELKKEVRPVAVTKAVTKPKPVVVKSTEPWPTIVFRGLIKNKDTNKGYVLLSINGKSKSLVEKDEIAGITIASLYPDSVVLVFNKEKKCFYKNKKQ